MALGPYPFNQYAAISKSDTVDIATGLTDAIYVGTTTGAAGTVAVMDQGGNAVSFVGLLAGTVYPIRAKRVKSTGTDATNLIALYWR